MVQIGALHVDFERREVRRHGEGLRLSARAFDILDVLFRANGAVVSKDALLEAVWPNQIVEENRLQVHVAALRKALHADRELIRTITGRGYRLAVPAGPANPPAPLLPASGEPPAGAGPLIGRDGDLDDVLARLAQSSVVTLVGAGGIGKTALALRVAQCLRDADSRARSQPRVRHVVFVELASADSREAVLATLAVALDPSAEPGPHDPLPLLAGLGEGTLLVLDNAEQVVGVVAWLVETLAAAVPGLRMLVTSREPLSIRAEAVHRVEPLAVPPADASLATLTDYGAVALFVQRARAIAPGSAPDGAAACAGDDASLRLVADICRRLDGLPLAIELAAARVATLGVDGVAARLDDRLDLLSGGLRLALPRHQTLRATFDWSYALLDHDARTLFRHLAFFAGSFTFDAVCAVATEPGMPIATAIEALAELSAKSLIAVEFHDAIALYRLTESTRAYAMEKLRDEGEVQRAARRHLRYLQRRIDESCCEARAGDHACRHAPCAGWCSAGPAPLDAARGIWDWAFSADGDPVLGVSLAGSLVGKLLDASLVAECRERAARALAALDALPEHTVDPLCEMRVCSAYATTLLLTGGEAGEAASLWRRVLARAESHRDEGFATRALWGLWNAAMAAGDIHASLRFATHFESRALASGSRWQVLCAGTTLAASLHCFGEHRQARERLERLLVQLDALGDGERAEGGPAVDPRIVGTGTLARIAWIQGETALAWRLAERALSHVRADLPEPSLCHLLAVVVVPLALACGEIEAAARHLALLRSQAALNRFDGWRDYGECLAGLLEMRTGQPREGLARLEACLGRLATRGMKRLMAPLVAACAEALTAAGRFEAAREWLDQAQRHGEVYGDQGFAAELLRARGLVEIARARRHGTPAAVAAARRHLHEARELAREQGAHLFELRAVLDLGESLRDAPDFGQQMREWLLPFRALLARTGMSLRVPEAARLAALCDALRAHDAQAVEPA
ncbi:ATP-binding protein [Burkholderia glumae]|uniref:ATP-binding protein n=1 Tax=Burkholderia glumae TaxID=337 RepID=UPI000C2773CB|nr:winged helix-turn-helix domain-containing protein [Burkholderia glumae]MCM2550834.1 winged helix-turn-helix domain-containing protein [Burkholderia glumae]NVE24101.1 winged helix-turn-helix domain-containing protein [Burkholderia glumae]PJO21489.1 transcriptional regulator [Burkholderia glumae AU6208]QGA40231.1 transcriptional regulator [Burkholderia glumae]QHE12536.1 transcriptional regulator [Burkholderia glumae AU6208]